MIYTEAMDYINHAYKLGSKLGLENITELMNRLGNPQHDYQIVHVAGTNGKGSTCAMISSILKEASYRTGLFISPHVCDFRERIQVNGELITEECLAETTEKVKEQVDTMVADGLAHPTGYEIVVAIGFLFFSRIKVDMAVIEVGLGGRLDATNVVDPILSVITSISKDHSDYLGDTVVQIAKEKAGIIKPNKPVVIGVQTPDVTETLQMIAEERQSRVYLCEAIYVECESQTKHGQELTYQSINMTINHLNLKLLGKHQQINVKTAICAIEALIDHGVNVEVDAIREGVARAEWPGRFEIIQLKNGVTVVLDGAHNEAGAKALTEAMKTVFGCQPYSLVIGMLKDKDLEPVIKQLTSCCHTLILTSPTFKQRAAAPNQLEPYVSNHVDYYEMIENVKVAVERGIELARQNQTPLVIAGSLYLIGDIRKMVLNQAE